MRLHQTRRALLAAGLAVTAGQGHGLAAGLGEALEAACGGPLEPGVGLRRAEAEIRRLHARADLLLAREGLAQGGVSARFAALFADPRWLYADSDAGRDRAVADMNARLAQLRPRLSGALGDLPVPAAVVRRMTADDEAAGRGGYREPPAYYVDLSAIRRRPAWTLPSVAFHETVPGHALLAAAGPDAGVDPEAWAIYAEQLACDLGAYAGDPRAELGYLHWRLFRMARTVADIGQGAMGWSPAKAVAAMRSIQGPDIAFAIVEEDVQRMRHRPGVYAAQGLGALAIARRRPGRRARWPDFHRETLMAGGWRCG